MKGFCISLDVSKRTSFYQGFKGIDEAISRCIKRIKEKGVITTSHNLDSYSHLYIFGINS